jgi:hypothetical protein
MNTTEHLSKDKEEFTAEKKPRKVTTILSLAFNIAGAILALVFMFVDDPGYNYFPLWWLMLPAFILHVLLLIATLKKKEGAN